jgi:hypothetical protein
VFSGKLSTLMTQSKDQVRIEAVSEPKPGEQPVAAATTATREVGGRDGPDPTRFGDWELRGRCIDF